MLGSAADGRAVRFTVTIDGKPPGESHGADTDAHGNGAVTLATRVATDEEIRDKLKDAIEDLRSAADRLQGKKSHGGRNTTLLVAGIALGILFNPVTGPETRRWLKDMIGGSDDFGGDYSSNGGT